MNAPDRLNRLLKVRALQADVAAGELSAAREKVMQFEREILESQDRRCEAMSAAISGMRDSSSPGWLYGLCAAEIQDLHRTRLQVALHRAAELALNAEAAEQNTRREREQIALICKRAAEERDAHLEKTGQRSSDDLFLALRSWRQRAKVKPSNP